MECPDGHPVLDDVLAVLQRVADLRHLEPVLGEQLAYGRLRHRGASRELDRMAGVHLRREAQLDVTEQGDSERQRGREGAGRVQARAHQDTDRRRDPDRRSGREAPNRQAFLEITPAPRKPPCRAAPRHGVDEDALGDDALVTVTMSRSERLCSARHRRGDSRLGPRSGNRRSCADVAAHGGCVWCATVKDPRRFPNKRQFAGHAKPLKRASPNGTGEARSHFWTFRNRAGFRGHRSASGKPRECGWRLRAHERVPRAPTPTSGENAAAGGSEA
jgi:hypothetical protein